MRRSSRLAVIIGAAAAAVGVSPGLAAASPATPGAPGIAYVSPIASGYAAVPKPGGSPAFIHVQSTYRVPAVNCVQTPDGVAQTRAGLDGISDGTVERVGINERCSNGVASYTAWYQMAPAAAANTFHPAPGDLVTASVTEDAGVYTLTLNDATSGLSFTVARNCSSCLHSSAEVTAGSPAGVTPADFGSVKFTGIVVTDNAGTSGGLANPAWNTDKLFQPGSPHTVAGPLATPANSVFTDLWA